MFAPTGLFKGIDCPQAARCTLSNCIFSHEKCKYDMPKEISTSPTVVSSGTSKKAALDNPEPLGGNRKRLKLDNGEGLQSRHAGGLETSKYAPGPRLFTGTIKSSETKRPQTYTGNLSSSSDGLASSRWAPSAPKARRVSDRAIETTVDQPSLPSLSRPITPPKAAGSMQLVTATKRKNSDSTPSHPVSVTTQTANPGRVEDLNPRLVSTHPAPHTTRLGLLRALHDRMSQLNREARTSKDAASRSLGLAPNELIIMALDQEERIALNQPSVYINIMGQLIVTFRKMDLAKWLSFRKKLIESKQPLKEKLEATAKQYLNPDLNPSHELLLLSRFHINLSGLDKHGYVLEAPLEAQIAATERAVKICDYWETCDRCGTRFQVFPNRRVDGALTAGGKCRYHWAKAFKARGASESTRPCCGQPPGSAGCAVHETHVFRTSDPKRLAAALQFEQTPENPVLSKVEDALSFDCEMGYTTHGTEVIRLSVTRWPSGEKSIDALVRPMGHILDLNTRFSGVTADVFLNAEEFDPNSDSRIGPSSSESQETLKILPSPAAARTLLFSMISPHTRLLGHAIENDLNVMRIIHPTIVDTALIYPHPSGLPRRLGLKRLAKEFLGWDIQKGGAEGHDSLEDARATGELVRAKIAREWIVLKSRGWSLGKGGLDALGNQASLPNIIPPSDLEGEEKAASKYCLRPVKGWWTGEKPGIIELVPDSPGR